MREVQSIDIGSSFLTFDVINLILNVQGQDFGKVENFHGCKQNS